MLQQLLALCCFCDILMSEEEGICIHDFPMHFCIRLAQEFAFACGQQGYIEMRNR
jgi:hypothetical protein